MYATRIYVVKIKINAVKCMSSLLASHIVYMRKKNLDLKKRRVFTEIGYASSYFVSVWKK